jgi:hypothetical protein
VSMCGAWREEREDKDGGELDGAGERSSLGMEEPRMVARREEDGDGGTKDGAGEEELVVVPQPRACSLLRPSASRV